MQILQTGQRETLPDAHLQLHLSGAAARGVIVGLSEAQRPLRVDLAEHPLGELLTAVPGGLNLDLAHLPADIQTVAVLHSGGSEHGAVQLLSAGEHYGYLGPASTGATGTGPVWLLELYRRNGGWRVRAVGEVLRTFGQLHPALPEMIEQATTRARGLSRPPRGNAAGPPSPSPSSAAPSGTPPSSAAPIGAASIILQAFRQLRGLVPAPEAHGPESPPAPAELSQVSSLRQALKENLGRARLSGDPLWLYDAQAALSDYLPTTLTLHTRTHGLTLTPALETALADILRIATARQPLQDNSEWEIQQRFLHARAEEASGDEKDNLLKL